jgi:hypothetical protein
MYIEGQNGNSIFEHYTNRHEVIVSRTTTVNVLEPSQNARSNGKVAKKYFVHSLFGDEDFFC